MPQRKQVHIDRALTNLSVQYMQEATNFIADKVFPIVPVAKQSDTYFIYNREDFFRDEAQIRAKGTESAGGTFDVDTAPPYFCRKIAFHSDVTEEDRVNADTPLRPNEDATEYVSQKLLLRRENAWAHTYFKPSVWGREIQGVDTTTQDEDKFLQFDNPASDPIGAIARERTRMAEATGYKPNTLVMSPYVLEALKVHPEVLDRIKYTQKGIVTMDLLASLFEVDNVYVPWAVQSAGPRKATADVTKPDPMKFIMGKHILLAYVEKNPGIKKPSAGYIFAWTGLLGAGAYGNRVQRIDMPWLGMDTERIEAEMAFDMQKVAGDLGTFLKDVVA